MLGCERVDRLVSKNRPTQSVQRFNRQLKWFNTGPIDNRTEKVTSWQSYQSSRLVRSNF